MQPADEQDDLVAPPSREAGGWEMRFLILGLIFSIIIGGAYIHTGDSNLPAQINTSPQIPSDRDLELAALTNLNLPFSSAYFPKSDSELDQTQKWIDEKRAWLLTLEDMRIRKAYAHWIDYAQIRLNENREENKTHAERIAYEGRTKARNEEWARGRAAASTIPRP